MERTRDKKNKEIYEPGDREQIETSGFLTGRQPETIARYTYIYSHNYTSKRIIRLSGDREGTSLKRARYLNERAGHVSCSVRDWIAGRRTESGRPASAPVFRVALHRGDERFSEDPDPRASGRARMRARVQRKNGRTLGQPAKAAKISWRSLLLSPPAVSCQPLPPVNRAPLPSLSLSNW